MKLQIARAQALLKQSKSNPDEAIQLLKPLTGNKNVPWPVLHYLGIAFMQKKDHQTALKFFDRAIEKGGEEPETYHSISICYYEMARFEEAEWYAKEALRKRDHFFKAWLHLGSVYRAQAKLNDALKCYQKANELDPKNAGVAFRIASIYNDQGDLNKALELFEITTKVDPDYHEAYIEQAKILRKQDKFEKAEKCLNKLLKKDRYHLGARVTMAELYKKKGNYERAIELYERLIDEYPKYAGLRVNYALCLQELGRFEESEKHYQKAFEDQPDTVEPLSNYLMGLHYNPVRSKKEIFEAHKLWDQYFSPEERPNRPVPDSKDPEKKLRIGFISGGFRRHPVGWMITKALENLPDDQFEIYCYTTNNIIDQITKRIHAVSDKWRSVIGYDHEVLAKMIREDKIDILVELSGHAADNRLKTVVLEPAPVIVKWVGGLFNTSGLRAIDYLITDYHESPPGEEGFYTEKLVRMPDDYVTFLPPDYAPAVSELPAEENGYITFGCFNNPSKVNNEILIRWAEIMNRVPGSKLFLKSRQYDTEALRERIISLMKEQGISVDRLLFEGQSPHDELLDCYNRVDIALDPWPYSGGLTTCEALWMGVPVITKPGPTFAGRHSATHLINAGCSEWVAENWEEYIELAVGLAEDRELLSDYRRNLREKIAKSPLCDGERFGFYLSKAFREMWKQRVESYRHDIDEWQDPIDVQNLCDSVPEFKTGNEMPEINKSLINSIHTNGNGTSTELPENQSSVPQEKVEFEHQSESYVIETRDDVRVCTPQDLNILTTYVLLEQEQWFEPELDFVRTFVESGMKILDIGAGFGVYSLPMSKMTGNQGKVYAFEPGSEARRYLEMGKIVNKMDQLEVIGRAVGKKGRDTSLSVDSNPELNHIDENGTEPVKMIAIDSWWKFEGQPVIDFVKLDVNGFESNALLGMQKLLEDSKPCIQVAVSDDDVQNEKVKKILGEQNYQLFEYVSGTGLLTRHNEGAEKSPRLMNIIAIHNESVEKFMEKGWIYDETCEQPEPEPEGWKEYLKELPWGSQVQHEWQELESTPHNKEYLKALNYLCLAEKMVKPDGSGKNQHSEAAILMLDAAQILIRLYNSGQSGVAVSLSLVRVLNQLGRQGQAAEVMQKLIESTMLDRDNLDTALPFLLPFRKQDHLKIKTDFNNWLLVRIAESWPQLKEVSSYFNGDQEKRILDILEDHPECSPEVRRTILLYKAILNEESKLQKSELLLSLEKDGSRNLNLFREIASQKSESAGKTDHIQSVNTTDSTDLKNLMLITTDFPPYDDGRVGHSIRAYTMANFFAKKGYKVYLVILHDLVEDREAPEMHENISILNFTYEKIKKSANTNIDLTSFCIYCIEKLNINTILSSSPPLNSHIIAKSIKSKYGDKVFWICDIRDIISIHPVTRKDDPEESRKQKLFETKLMAASDAVTTVATGMRKTIFEIHEELKLPYDEDKFSIVENGFIEQQEVAPEKELVDFIRESREEGRIVLFYAGTGSVSGQTDIKKGNKDLTFLFNILSEDPDLRNQFSLVVQGKIHINKKYISHLNSGFKFQIRPPVPNEQMLANLKLADIGVNMNLDRVQAPGILGGKLYDYIYSGLGLLLIYPDNAYSLFEFANKHDNKPYFADVFDKRSIANALHKILDEKNNLNEKKFDREEVEQYNRYNLYEEFLEVINKKDSMKRRLPSREIMTTIKTNSGKEFNIAIPEKELFRLKNIFRDEEYKLPDDINLPENPVIVDIGANVGSFALYASTWAKNCTIHSFEPNPQVLPMLEKNTKYIHVSVYPCALSDAEGEITLNQHPNSTGGASVSKKINGAGLVSVPVRDARSMFEELQLSKIDILKIDTEGSEIDILNSLGNFIDQVHVIMLEYHSEEDRAKINEILSDFILSDEIVARKNLGTLKFINPNYQN